MEMLNAKEKYEESIWLRNSRRVSYPRIKKEIIYPDSDGKPMADNTKQFDWIVKIKENLEQIFADNPDVFVAGDLLWYPVCGNNKIRIAPDAMVVFGRPKGHRGSYRMWEEGNIAPHVVFEILSPGNRPKEMQKKLGFYDFYGVREYYIYDPDHIRLSGWIRKDNILNPIENMRGWISPLLNIRFEIGDDDLYIFGPDGKKFLSRLESERQHQTELLKERQKTDSENRKLKTAKQKAESEHKRAESEHKRAESERLRAEQLAAKLRELGVQV